MEKASTIGTECLKTEIMSAADKIKALMALRGMGNADLARAIGQSEQTVGRWLKGDSEKGIPDLSASLRIARYFDVSLDYLADDSLDEEPPSPFGHEAFRKLELMDGLDYAEVKQIIMKLIKEKLAQERAEAAANAAATQSPVTSSGNFHKASFAVTQGGATVQGKDGSRVVKGKPAP